MLDNLEISNEDVLNSMFKHATIGILVTNKQSKILLTNPYLLNIFNYEESDLKGKEIEILLPDSLKKAHVNHRNKFTENPQNRPMGIGMNLQGKRKDGSLIPVEISLSHIKLHEEVLVIAFINDITIRKNQEQKVKEQKSEILRINNELEKRVSDRTKMLQETLLELEHSKKELEEALNKEKELSEMKSAFVTMASHEFKTPLATILSSSSLIEKYKKEEEQANRAKHLNRIKSSVRNLNNILEDFLSLGKLEERKILEIKKPFFVSDLINIVTNELKDLLKPGQTFQCTHTGNNEIYSDERIIENILINLVSNAIKYSPENSPIEIQSSVYNSSFEISISDHGMGISKEDQQHLFTKFFRSSSVSTIQGTGLGLYIVNQYLDLIGGEIKFFSELKKGTTFTVKIPIT